MTEIKTQVIALINSNMSIQGVTGAEMARRLGTSPGQVYKILSGEGNPNVSTLSNMLNSLGLAVHVEAFAMADHTEQAGE
jgi:DNA-binding phage protein